MKAISTEQTPANIALVLSLLTGIPTRLAALANAHPPARLLEPLGPADRSAHEVLVHIINCEAVTANTITLALLLKEPLVPAIHPERDLGKLTHLERQPFPDLLTYFTFRRTVLLDVLNGLSEAKWGRAFREEGKQRKESVYLQARGLALHEDEHLAWLAEKLGGSGAP